VLTTDEGEIQPEDELACLVEKLVGVSTRAPLYYYLLAFAERPMLSYGISH
jgi:hypothetical protein